MANVIDELLGGLIIIKSRVDDPAVVVRSRLVHCPEALQSEFLPQEQTDLTNLGWEIHSAEDGYMYRMNKPSG